MAIEERTEEFEEIEVPDETEEVEILFEGEDEIPEEESEAETSASEPESKNDAVADQIAALQAQLAQQQQGSTIDEAVSKLAEVLRPQQKNDNAPQITREQLEAEIRAQDFYTDPYKAVLAAAEKISDFKIKSEIAPAFQQMYQQVQQVTQTTSKQQAQAKHAVVFEKYAAEIEQVAKSLPPGPDVYDRAAQQVTFQHMDDIVNAKIEEALAKVSGAPVKAPPSTANSLPAALVSGGNPSSKAKNYIRVNEKDARIAQRVADEKGLSRKEVVELFREYPEMAEKYGFGRK